MKLRKVTTGVISIIIIIALFYVLWELYYASSILANRWETNTRYYILTVCRELLIAIICFLSTRNWFEYFMSGGIKIKIIPLIIGSVILIIGAIPAMVWIMNIGLGGNFKMILNTPATHHIISAVAGVLIGRAFLHKTENAATSFIEGRDPE